MKRLTTVLAISAVVIGMVGIMLNALAHNHEGLALSTLAFVCGLFELSRPEEDNR